MTVTADHLSVTARDGLRLHVSRHAPASGAAQGALPVVCLPGLTRTTEDFVPLARALAGDASRPRTVYALDYRGRGRSDYDRPENYTLPVELDDLQSVLTALDIGRAVFVGTSRGGLLTMLLAPVRPGAIAGAVLNDIGPVIEPAGLMRIKSYVGKLPQPESMNDAAEMLQRLFGAQFPRLGPADWQAWARRSYAERDGRLVPTYDPRLEETLKDVSLERPLPSLWPQFDALARVPVKVIRGQLTDLLSEETVAAMRARRHGDLQVHEASGEGHAPLLDDPAALDAISGFVTRAEAVPA